jgi:hypothetical protein
MIAIFLFVIFGVALFVSFLVLAVQGTPGTAPDSSAVSAVSQMVNLSLVDSNRLLDDTEYLLLRSNPALAEVAGQLRKERQELALLWITLLLNDLKELWRFRRFLIRSGAPTTFGEEYGILQALVISVVLLNLMKVSIRIAGPFALPRAGRRAGRLVVEMSYAAATVLHRIPAAGWPEVERSWTSSVA